MISLIEIWGTEYVLFPNTMLVFSLLEHDCLYFICYYLHRDQWCGSVLFCTLQTCVVKMRPFLCDKHAMYFVVTNNPSWVSVTAWLLLIWMKYVNKTFLS